MDSFCIGAAVAVGDLKCEHIEHESDRMVNGSSLNYCWEEDTTLNVSTYT